MKSLHFLIGLPRSGKSTFAHQRFDRGWTVICPDKIRLALGHRWNGLIEPYVAAVKDTMVRTLIQDYNVVLDETHTTYKSIFNTLLINPAATYTFIDTPADVCKGRAFDTGQVDLYPIIDRMEMNLMSLCCCKWETLPSVLPSVIDDIRLKVKGFKEHFERKV